MDREPLALRPLTVVVLSDGVPGHDRSSAGVLTALALRRSLSTHTLRLAERRPRSRRLARVAAALGRPASVLCRLADLTPAPPARADLVISTGPATAAANIALARAIGARSLYCGFAKWPILGIDFLLTPVPTAHRAAIVTPRPTDVDATRLPPPRKLAEPGPRELAVLFGGDSKHHRYRPEEAVSLGHALAAILGERPDWSLTLYDSRRTSPETFEALASAAGATGTRVRAVRYAQSGLGSNAPAFMADAALVTADSLSMVTEAIASARPTLVIAPATYRGPRRDRREIAALAGAGLCATATFETLSLADLLATPTPLTRSAPADLADRLAARGI